MDSPTETSRPDMIEFLIGERFPDRVVITAWQAATIEPGSRSIPGEAELQKRARELDAYQRHLSSIPSGQLRSEYEKTVQVHQRGIKEPPQSYQARLARLMAPQRAANEQAAKEEQGRIWNEPGAEIEIAHWSRAAVWTLEEATALSLGKDPRVARWLVVRSHWATSPFAQRYIARRDLLLRAKMIGAVSDPDYPTRFLVWLKKADLGVSDELWTETHTWSPRPRPGNRPPSAGEPVGSQQRLPAYDVGLADAHDAVGADLERQCAAQRDRIKELELELAAAQKLKRSSDPKVVDSLRKLVIGMACGRYKFDASKPRNDATGRICTDLTKLGISLDDETVLARLRECWELLPARQPLGE